MGVLRGDGTQQAGSRRGWDRAGVGQGGGGGGGRGCDARPSCPETITSLFKTSFRVDVPFDLPEIFFFVALG